MDNKVLQKMIEQLRQELREIRYALWALEAVARGKPLRGRPPKTSASQTPARRRSRKAAKKVPPNSPAGR